MPKKTIANETAAAAPVRTANPKTARPTPVSRVKSVKHSKAAAPVIIETVAGNAHDEIAKIAYRYWEARGCQHGSPELDWLRAEQEYLLSV